MGEKALRFLFAAIVFFCMAERAVAQSYPDRPITLIVPFAAGGAVDTSARLIAQRLTATIGTVIVDNRPGAGGAIAAKVVARAHPDGYTLFFGSSGTLAIGPQLNSDAGYDPVKSFTPVSMVASIPFLMAVNPSLPVHSVESFVAYAKANPGKINFGAPTGTPPHLAGELFKTITGTDIVQVPYKATNLAISDLLGGHIQVVFGEASLLLGLVKEGKLRALATMTTKRVPELPDVPAMPELGYPDLIVTSWTGVVAPAGTPTPIVVKLNAAINDGLRSPELGASLTNLMAQPMIGSPSDFSAFIAEQIAKWGTVIRTAGIKAE